MLGTLSQEEIETVLERQVLGRIGMLEAGAPYIVPVTYVYDREGDSIYFHAAEGAKVRAMRADPRVCFEVEEIDDMANWRTVIARALYDELWRDEGERAMDLIIRRLAPLRTSESAFVPRREEAHRQHGIDRPVLGRLRLEAKTGRFERT